jgi:NADH-quinone oxidoreductase subunit F
MTKESTLLLRDPKKDWTDIDVAIKEGGDYSRLKTWMKRDPMDLLNEVKSASLRGRGGAGFPAGLKWSFVPRDTDKPKYLVCNADEGEPGTFKDRYWLEVDPHPHIEGCILTCFAVQANACYIYIRGEFIKGIEVTNKAIQDAYDKGFLGKNILGTGFDLEMYIHPGAGAYICGEETGLLESLEGKPGRPRLKPPFPAVIGAFGCPTVINNVETLVNVPIILEMGHEAYNALGTEKNGGTKVWCVSGHVKKPGLYEFPLGTNLKEILYDYCGGILDDRPLKGVIPGGASCPVLTPDEIDIAADFDSLKSVGSLLGTCGAIVIAEPTCILQALLRLCDFYAHESCGQCTPCRDGTGWVAKMVRMIEDGNGTMEHIDMLLDVCGQMEGNTICALSDAAAWPVQAVLKKYLPEVKKHIEIGGCPYDDPEYVAQVMAGSGS